MSSPPSPPPAPVNAIGDIPSVDPELHEPRVADATPAPVVTKAKKHKHVPNPLNQQRLAKANPPPATEQQEEHPDHNIAHPGLLAVPLYEIFFTQATINPNFYDGRSLEETVDLLCKVDQSNAAAEWHDAVQLLPPIRVYFWLKRWWSLDNRRLYCMKVSADQLKIGRPTVEVLRVEGNSAASEFRAKKDQRAVDGQKRNLRDFRPETR